MTPVDNGSLIVYLGVNSLKNKKSDPIHILMDSKLTSKKKKTVGLCPISGLIGRRQIESFVWQ